MQLQFKAIKMVFALSVINNLKELCGPETEITLTEEGENSSVTLLLNPGEESTCKLKVIAPYTHIVNVQFVESSEEIHRALIINKTVTNPPCMLSMVS